MFVSIVIDPGSDSRAHELGDILAQYGLKMAQQGVWESSSIASATLDRVKNDLDKATAFYDKIRIYQFPIDGAFVITTLTEKKWRRLVARGNLRKEAEIENPGIVKRRS